MTEELSKYKVYNLTELEPILGVSHQTIVRYVKAGKLKANKIGGKWKVSEENLKNFIEGDN